MVSRYILSCVTCLAFAYSLYIATNLLASPSAAATTGRNPRTGESIQIPAKKVTQERMYLETMEKVLADIDKVIIDKKAGGVVPYLPLPELTKKPKGTDTQ